MPPKKEAKPDIIVEVGFVLIVLLMLWMIWSTIFRYLFGSFTNFWHAVSSFFLAYLYPLLIVASVILSVFALVGFVVYYRKLLAIGKEEAEVYGSPKVTKEEEKEDEKKNERWNHALAHLNSPNASDWRL